MFIRMLSHAIKVKENLHSKNAFSWRYTLSLLIIIRFKTSMRNIRYFDSLTGGWINYSHNQTLVKLFSQALVCSEDGHISALAEVREDIETQKQRDKI